MIDSGSIPPNFQKAMQRPTTLRVPTPPQPQERKDSITFWIEGEPEPAGSKSAFVPTDKIGNPYRGLGGRIIVNVVDANPKAKKWKAHVNREARLKFTRPAFQGAVECQFEFFLLRPKSVKESERPFPTVKPDALKLARGTEDALTGVCWTDDAQVVRQIATKSYGPRQGVRITLSEVNPDTAPKPEQIELHLPPAAKPIVEIVDTNGPLPF